MKKLKGRPGTKIMCINDGKIFSSISQAAEYYKISQAAISNQLAGTRKTVGGNRFVKISDDMSTDDLNLLRNTELKNVFKIVS